jgi:hypothetical protein
MNETGGTHRRVDDGNRRELDETDDDPYHGSLHHSIHNDYGLEIGVRITWPGISTEIELSACLPESELAPMFDGTQWAGTRVWTASMVGTQYLLALTAETSLPFHQPMSLLELGCGLGVPGMIWHLFQRQQQQIDSLVVLTDMPSLLPQLQRNLDHNQLLWPDQVWDSEADLKGSRHCIRAESLEWSAQGIYALNEKMAAICGLSGDRRQQLERFPWDIVVCCDCIFEPLYGTAAWQQLLACQLILLQQNPRTIMITVVERRNHDGINRYLQQVHKYVTRGDGDSTALGSHEDEQAVISRVEKVDLTQFSLNPKPPAEIEIYRIHGRGDCRV